MLQSIGTTEVVVVALVVVMLFGGQKIPELVKGIAEAIREFKRAAKD